MYVKFSKTNFKLSIRYEAVCENVLAIEIIDMLYNLLCTNRRITFDRTTVISRRTDFNEAPSRFNGPFPTLMQRGRLFLF